MKTLIPFNSLLKRIFLPSSFSSRRIFGSLGLVVVFLFVVSGEAVSAGKIDRTEIYSIASVTLSDTEVLNGVQQSKPVAIAGILNIPTPGKEKIPAVVILHGSSGPGGSEGVLAEWSNQLNSQGIATFGLDCFSSRGIVTTSSDQGQLGRLNMVVDAYRALELLAKHPRIDSTKIALLGVSRGGQGALYAAMRRLQSAYAPPGIEFSGFLAVYPNCVTSYIDDTITTGKPIAILHGTADNYNPIDACRGYVDRAKKNSANIQLMEYRDAHHAFDAEALKTPVQCKKCQTDRNCRIAEQKGGVIMNLDTQKPFDYSDSCVETGTTLAFSEAEAGNAKADARKFFLKLFGTN